MLQEEDSEFRVYLMQLEQHQEDCKQLLNQVSGTLGKLSKLSDQYGFVSNKTNSLHEACEQMLTDQTKLATLADDLESRVSFFLEYEKIQLQLSSPTLSVHGELFHNILDRLDRCIAYMQSHVSPLHISPIILHMQYISLLMWHRPSIRNRLFTWRNTACL